MLQSTCPGPAPMTKKKVSHAHWFLTMLNSLCRLSNNCIVVWHTLWVGITSMSMEKMNINSRNPFFHPWHLKGYPKLMKMKVWIILASYQSWCMLLSSIQAIKLLKKLNIVMHAKLYDQIKFWLRHLWRITIFDKKNQITPFCRSALIAVLIAWLSSFGGRLAWVRAPR